MTLLFTFASIPSVGLVLCASYESRKAALRMAGLIAFVAGFIAYAGGLM